MSPESQSANVSDSITTEQIVLAEIRRHVQAHPSRELIESIAKSIRNHARDEAGRIALALVGAELAAA